MPNNPLENASACPIADIPTDERTHAMRLGIAFNGTQFIYLDFKYDRLTDAISYAEQENARTLNPPVASTPKDWLERPVPSVADLVLMNENGIVFDGWRYRFREYRYDRLADALNYSLQHRS